MTESKGDTLETLNDLLDEGFSVAEISSDAETLMLSLRRSDRVRMVRLNRQEALRMIGEEPEDLHPLLS